MGVTRRALLASMEAVPSVWLYQVFGSPDRYRQIRRQIESEEGI